MRTLLLSLLLFILINNSFSQNTGIGIGTANPHQSAAFEISDSSRGLLIPRMTQSQRLFVSSPAKGLLIYQTDNQEGFWYYDGIKWLSLVPTLPIQGTGTEGQTLKICNGVPVWTTSGTCPGILSELNCSGATNYGYLISGLEATGIVYSPITFEPDSSRYVASYIPYTGALAGPTSIINIPSTGVTGLIAKNSAGSLNSGPGTYYLNITGTPSSSGIASFALSIGGKDCIFSRTVYPPGSIASLNCASATHIGTLYRNTSASGITSTIPYSGGNGNPFYSQSIASTGVTGLTATVSTGTFANGSGSLLFKIEGTPSTNGTASFAINIGGQTCTLTRSVSIPPGTISNLDCDSVVDAGVLSTGISYFSGITTTVFYQGGNSGSFSAVNLASTGVTGLTAKINAGTFALGSGSLIFSITGTPSGAGIASFSISVGGKNCIIRRTVYSGGTTNVSTNMCGAPLVHNYNLPYGTLTDQQGNQYRTIRIGNQEWMAENLRTTVYLNGIAIENVTSQLNWANYTNSAYCFYENSSSYQCAYGALYNAYVITDSRKVCPTGWHIPNDTEWGTLIKYLDSKSDSGTNYSLVAGIKLRNNEGTTYWTNASTVSNNSSGFSALPGGERDTYFTNMGLSTEWWSSTPGTSSLSKSVYLNFNLGIKKSSAARDTGHSIRCVKD